MISALLLMATAAPQAPFSIVVLPDTQYYSQFSALTPTFEAQTQWVIDRLDSDRIAFVTHVGDIVQNGAQGASQNLAEWTRADGAMSILDGDPAQFPEGLVPYSAAIGNHDYAVVGSKASGGARYRQYFGPSRYAGRSWYVGTSSDGLSHAQRFETPLGDWLHIALEWRPSDGSLAFGQEMIQQHPGLPVLLTTHEHLSPGARATWRATGATPDSSGDNSAEQVFRKLIEPNPEVVALFCGHISGSGWRSDQNAFGRFAHQVLADFQFDPGGGNGWLMQMTVDDVAEKLRFRTQSPTYVPGVTAGADRSTDPLANFDLTYDAVGHRAELAERRVLRFRQGQAQAAAASLYAGTVDTYLGSGAAGSTLPGTGYGAAIEVRCDGDADFEQGLLAFEDLIGTGAGQIPPGSTIHRAALTLTTEGGAADSTTGGTLHQMLVPWNEDSTWTSLGAGIQLGSEARLAIVANSRGLVTDKGTRTFDVTQSVSAWASGDPNHGWAILAGGTNRWSFRSSEWSELMERPLLTVQFTEPCPAPISFCPALANSTGNVGFIELVGSTSLSENDFTLVATGLPIGAPALFLAGPARTEIPAGDGTLCVGGAIRRLPPAVVVSFLTQATLSVNLAEAPLGSVLFPGASWSFQCWHRDSTPGGSNLSDAIEVQFCD